MRIAIRVTYYSPLTNLLLTCWISKWELDFFWKSLGARKSLPPFNKYGETPFGWWQTPTEIMVKLINQLLKNSGLTFSGDAKTKSFKLRFFLWGKLQMKASLLGDALCTSGRTCNKSPYRSLLPPLSLHCCVFVHAVLECFCYDLTLPIGSMYGIFTYI